MADSTGSFDSFDALKRLIDAQKQILGSSTFPTPPTPSSLPNNTTPSIQSVTFTPFVTSNTGNGFYDAEEFETGDECEIIGNTCFHHYETGSVVTLVERMSTSGVEWKVKESHWFVHERDMKKKKKKIALKYDPSKLDALIIEHKVKDEILAVLNQHKNQDKLFIQWGLGDVIEYGKGMTFMFYGGPGTGKTWAANCIAKAFGIEILVISAADIQSSEPGGANRAIQAAFKEAKSKGRVLFIDECDSLIASRNDLGMILASEVNTLLTEIEKFEGVAILATNRIEHMDEALERRISLIVEFPNPDFEARKKIWKKLLPEKMPLGKGVSVELLSKDELTGGQIKNVVLQAARMAVSEDSEKVEIKHFDSAIARLKKSKNLMGQASRYRQGIVRDDHEQGMGVSKLKSKKIKDFLEEES